MDTARNGSPRAFRRTCNWATQRRVITSGGKAARAGRWLLATSLLGWSSSALAQSESAVTERGSDAIRWRPEWRRADAIDYLVIGGATAGILTTQFAAEVPKKPRWVGRNAIDDGVRDVWAFNSRSARNQGATVSDWLFYSTAAYPVLVDTLFVTWLGRGNPDVAWQLLVLDTEALSVSAFIGRLGQRLGGRKRPMQIGCEERGNQYHKFCPTTPESFISGHVAMSFTGATLICVNHHELPLYGAPWADAVVCYAGLAAATATASLRINADMHWFSDVMLGAALGACSGYLFSSVAHYTTVSTADAKATLLPEVTPETLGLQLVGVF